MRGRKPKPTALVKLHGKTSAGRKPRSNEPTPVGELLTPPDWLTDPQKAGWQYAIEHAPFGLLKNIDQMALAVWCVAADLYRQASTQVARQGLLTPASPVKQDCAMVQNPMLAVLNRQATILMRVMGELGFSPASRPRIGQQPALVDHGPSLREAPGGTVVSLDEYLRSAPPD